MDADSPSRWAAQTSLGGAIVVPAKDNVESLKAAIRTCYSYGVNADRGWLEPLLSVLVGRET